MYSAALSVTAAGQRNSRTVTIMKTISLERSVAMIPDGATLMIGGFMAVGTPERVVNEIVRQGKRDPTVIANDTATPAIGKLVAAKLLRKAVTSHIGLNPETQRQMMAGELEVELVPQGTLVERIRAGGYGLGGVLTPTASAHQWRKASSASSWTARATCWKPRYAPTSPWFTLLWPTISATSDMR
jgi:acyl CoA:acetate/3-ketoacid CoA transferase alpha subunit